ncbi:MAG: RNA methyltransferase PUA domain-containing protein, partial [Acidobacteriota bacterium]
MQAHRFHTPADSITGTTIQLSAEESHHLCRVLRLREGATVFA